MRELGPRVAVGSGLVTTPFLVLPMINLLMGDCFWEQGCGRYESLKLAAAFLAACTGGVLVALCIGWVAAKLPKVFARYQGSIRRDPTSRSTRSRAKTRAP